MVDKKLVKFKEYLLKNTHAITWNINIASKEDCFQQKVNPWRWEWVLMLDVWRCKIKKYQAVDLEINRLEKIYYDLKKIFEE